MSEVIVLTQLTRKIHLTFRMLVTPSIISVLVIIISIFSSYSHPYDYFFLSFYSFQAAGCLSGPTFALKANSLIR